MSDRRPTRALPPPTTTSASGVARPRGSARGREGAGSGAASTCPWRASRALGRALGRPRRLGSRLWGRISQMMLKHRSCEPSRSCATTWCVSGGRGLAGVGGAGGGGAQQQSTRGAKSSAWYVNPVCDILAMAILSSRSMDTICVHVTGSGWLQFCAVLDRPGRIVVVVVVYIISG